MEDEIVESLVQGIINAIGRTAEEANIPDPDRLAITVLSRVLMELTEAADGESLLVTLRKQPDGWKSHFHVDYLDADPEHLKQDFYWERADSDTER